MMRALNIRLPLGSLLALGLLALSGCSILPISDEAPTLYTLSPKNTFDTDLPTVTKQLLVELPIAAEGLNSHRIALSRDLLSIDYFAKARWTERGPQLVQTLLVESFENTGKIISVAREGSDLRADYSLKTELREFQAEYADSASPPNINVRIIAKLIKLPERVIVAAESFETNLPAGGTAMQDIVTTFDEALGKVLKRVVLWAMPVIAR